MTHLSFHFFLFFYSFILRFFLFSSSTFAFYFFLNRLWRKNETWESQALNDTYKHLSDVSVSRNWYKTVLFGNSYIYANLNKSCSIKQIIFNKNATNLKTTISHRIITYSPYYATRTWANGSAVSLSRETDGNYVTSLLRRAANGWSSGDVIRTMWYYVIILTIISVENAKKNFNRSKPEILRLLWDIVVFRLVAYLFYMICSILQFLYKIAYIWIFV